MKMRIVIIARIVTRIVACAVIACAFGGATLAFAQAPPHGSIADLARVILSPEPGTGETIRIPEVCLRAPGCSPDPRVEVLFAAFLRDIHRIYRHHGASLPSALVEPLEGIVPENVLAAARWAVAPDPNSDPTGDLHGTGSASGGLAVTVGDTMIFSRMPDLETRHGWIWLLHELRHVEQYLAYGPGAGKAIDGFAGDYLRRSGEFEQDAHAAAEAMFGALLERGVIE